MSDIAIKVEGLGKQYRLGEIGTGTISHDLNRWWARMRGKEDPFATVGDANDRTTKSSSDYVWSLRDVGFEVKKGEVLGIIGRNGAGKSTLLKILSKVTAPTTGNIKVNGRIASLLEVGTGFHPELTGRENIYLNGAILGMTKSEIRSKFDEIVDFSGVERYIDTPVKRYSSGMYVRLAFAVAAFLEPEILIVDEVLAVGDAEFQKKCLGRMKDVSVNDGRTVLFVSHSMPAVKQLCTRAILLKNGRLDFAGDVPAVLNEYNSFNAEQQVNLLSYVKHQSALIKVDSVEINGSVKSPVILDGYKIKIKISGICTEEIRLNLELKLFSTEHTMVSFYGPGHTDAELKTLEKGRFVLEDELAFPSEISDGEYYANIFLSAPNIEVYLEMKEVLFRKEGYATASGRNLTYNEIGFFRMDRSIQ